MKEIVYLGRLGVEVIVSFWMGASVGAELSVRFISSGTMKGF